jgi:hypothetical protein
VLYLSVLSAWYVVDSHIAMLHGLRNREMIRPFHPLKAWHVNDYEQTSGLRVTVAWLHLSKLCRY